MDKRFSESGMSATIIADSISPGGKRITTFELDYPRFIHAELMTHRVFSRNAASSRAIPVKKLLTRTLKQMVIPVYWGRNKSGMQANEELEGFRKSLAVTAWRTTGLMTVFGAWIMNKLQMHKQLANRPMEAFHNIKVVVTSTEWENWYLLRDHKDAQPEIQVLARLMRKCHEANQPEELKEGEWHVPYVERIRDLHSNSLRYFVNGEKLSEEEAVQISSSCCAQVSYRVLDTGKEKALSIYDKLITSEPRHSSPFEHCAKVMKTNLVKGLESWEEGVTHYDRNCRFWSNNFQGWIQYRAILEQKYRYL